MPGPANASTATCPNLGAVAMFEKAVPRYDSSGAQLAGPSARLQAVQPAPAQVSADGTGRDPGCADGTGRDPGCADGTGRDPAGSLVAMEVCPHCRRPIAVMVVPAAAGPGRRA